MKLVNDKRVVIFPIVHGLTKRAPDWWESARFQAVCVAWSGFRQGGVASSHPPAGNASRWAVHSRKKIPD